MDKTITAVSAKNYLEEEFQTVKSTISGSQKILIISHRNPDGDTVGSNLALRFALETQDREITCACADPIPKNLTFLPGSNQFRDSFTVDDYDCVITVDCGSTMMMKFPEKYPLLLKKDPFINIDHHSSNDGFGTVNLVKTESAATVIIIYYLLKFLDLKITPKIATCLLTGLYFDTGSFMHSTTTQEIYSIASDLLLKGAHRQKIVKNLFHSHSINQLRLWGNILERAKLNEKKIVVSMVTQEELLNFREGTDSLSGAIDFLNMVPGSKFSILISEDNEGYIRGSCRTQQNDIDLARIAGIFGGGGHRKAAGFSFKGRIEEDLLSAQPPKETVNPIDTN